MSKISSTTDKIKVNNEKKEKLFLDCIKDASVLYDKNKKQFSVKIPKEIAEIYKLKKKDKLRFFVKIREGEEVEGYFGVIKQ